MQGKHGPKVLHCLKMATIHLLGLDLGQQILSGNTQKFLKMAAVDGDRTSLPAQSLGPKGSAPMPPCAAVATLLIPGDACGSFSLGDGAVELMTSAGRAEAMLDPAIRQRADRYLGVNSYLPLCPWTARPTGAVCTCDA